jgi:Ran GTPase-activating protein (RanGAP) involved in mRNA processing and transport
MLDHEEIDLLQNTIDKEAAECIKCEGIESTENIAGMELCSMCASAAKRGAKEALEP